MFRTGRKLPFLLYLEILLGVIVTLVGLTCLSFGPDITDRDNIVHPRGINTCAAVFAAAGTFLIVRFLSRGFFSANPKEQLRTIYIDSLIGLFSMLVFGRTAYVVLSLANSHFDHSAVLPQIATISDKKYVHNTKGPSENDLHVTLRPGGEPVTLDVTPDLFKAVDTGEGLSVKLHPGALGFEWVEVIGKAE